MKTWVALSGVVNTIEGIEAKIKHYVEHGCDGPRFCHGSVANLIRDRLPHGGNSDKVVLIGAPKNKHVFHSVLTDKDGHVLMDTFKDGGGILKGNEYLMPGKATMSVLKVLTVKELLRK